YSPQTPASQALLRSLNSAYKSAAGKFIGLKDDRLMARQQNLDKRLRNSVERDPKLGASAGKVWDEVAAAFKNWTPFDKAFAVLERPGPFGSTLLENARRRLRNEAEVAGPAIDQ